MAEEGKKTLDKMASRKFILSVLGMVAHLFLAYTGRMDVTEAMTNVMVIVGVYVVGEAFVDGMCEKSASTSSLLGKLAPLLLSAGALKSATGEDVTK